MGAGAGEGGGGVGVSLLGAGWSLRSRASISAASVAVRPVGSWCHHSESGALVRTPGEGGGVVEDVSISSSAFSAIVSSGGGPWMDLVDGGSG